MDYLTMKNIFNNEAGFTLVELLVVVMVIGILTTLAVPAYVSTSYNSKLNTCKTNLRTLDDAIQTYISVHGKQPDSLNDLVPGFIKKVPTEPFGGSYKLKDADSEHPARAKCSLEHNY